MRANSITSDHQSLSLDLDGRRNLWWNPRERNKVADLDEASKNPIVRAEVERAVNKANELASRAESIRKFEIVPDEFTEENGLVTPSMKARRQAVLNITDVDRQGIYVPRKPAAHAE